MIIKTLMLGCDTANTDVRCDAANTDVRCDAANTDAGM